MNILDKITSHKRKEVERQKEVISIKQLEKSRLFRRSCSSLEKAVTDSTKDGIVTEFKRKSPSKSTINLKVQPTTVAQAYEASGASGISVLTDSHFFGGGVEDLQEVRTSVTIPILRKEFIIDEYQIIEAKSLGADAILLIAECLKKKEIRQFTETAQNLGLEVLLELYSRPQLDKVGPKNTLIGINNRDLTTFKVDIENAIALSRELPENTIKIAESGIQHPGTIIRMKNAGFDGFLMGERFMQNPSPGKAFAAFMAELNALKTAL